MTVHNFILDFSKNIYIRVIQKSILFYAYSHLVFLIIRSFFRKDLDFINLFVILDFDFAEKFFGNKMIIIGGILYLTLFFLILRNEKKRINL